MELNSALSVGGLTPSLAVLEKVKQDTDLKVICMVRPRGAGFCYNDCEKEIMLKDAGILLEHGADGIAFGFLKEDGSIDGDSTEEMVRLIHARGKEAVFHRAFDVCQDPLRSMELLIRLGVDRVLTSGQKAKALEGKELLKELQERYGAQIQILAGSGVNDGNAPEIMEYTGVQQVHSSCKGYREDPTTDNGTVSYAYLGAPHEMCYDEVSEELVKKLVETVQNS